MTLFFRYTLFFRSAPGVLVLCCLTSTAIDAGERIDIKGSYSGVDKSQSLEIGANHTLISVVDEGLGYLLDAPNDNTPMQYAAGPCGGFMEIKDNHASGHGYCLRSTPSGGKWIVRWVLDSDMSGGLKGTFEIIGVEGNATGWKGGGTWGPVVSTTPGRYITRFGGWLEMP